MVLETTVQRQRDCQVPGHISHSAFSSHHRPSHSPDTQHVVVEKDFWLETNFDQVRDNFHVL